MENTAVANLTAGFKRTGLNANKSSDLVPLVALLQTLICGENLLVIVLVGWSIKLRQLQNSFLINLAFSDFLYGSVAMTLAFYNFRYKLVWQSGPVVCVIAVSIQRVTLMTSSFSVLCATLDRLIALVCPFQYATHVTKLRVSLIICVIWCISIFVMFMPLLFPAIKGGQSGEGNVCDRRDHIVIALIVTQTVILVSASASLFLHVYICNVARRHFIAIQSTIVQNGRAGQTVIAISKASKMLLTISFFAVCIWTPNIIVEYYHYTRPDVYRKLFNDNKTTIILFQLLPAVGSFSNPWIYSFRNKDFRRAIRKLIGMKPNTTDHGTLQEISIRPEHGTATTRNNTDV